MIRQCDDVCSLTKPDDTFTLRRLRCDGPRDHVERRGQVCAFRRTPRGLVTCHFPLGCPSGARTTYTQRLLQKTCENSTYSKPMTFPPCRCNTLTFSQNEQEKFHHGFLVGDDPLRGITINKRDCHSQRREILGQECVPPLECGRITLSRQAHGSIPLRLPCAVGWSTYSAQQIASSSNAGFGSVPSYNNDPNAGSAGVVGGGAGEGQGVKARLINLIAAVRTLLRSESSG